MISPRFRVFVPGSQGQNLLGPDCELRGFTQPTAGLRIRPPRRARIVRGKEQHCNLAIIGQKLNRIPDHEKIAGVWLLTLLGVILACSVGGLQAGILLCQAVMMTAIAWLTHKYAKSADDIARLTGALGKTAPKQDVLTTARKAMQAKLVLHELLEELRKAEATRKPPFDLSAWERNSGKLKSSTELTDSEIQEIASCYGHLAEENMNVNRWRELDARLEGLVDCVKRRNIHMTLKEMEQDNLSVIGPMVSMLESHLRQWCEFGAKEQHAGTR